MTDDILHEEALRRYQVEISKYEDAVRKYKKQLQGLKKGDPRPLRPIPPPLPMKRFKFDFPDVGAPESPFNLGVEAAAKTLEEMNEPELAIIVRRHKKVDGA